MYEKSALIPLSERALLLLLAAVQFTHIMDFMIMMPLGPQLMRELHIGPGQFSALVAAYTVSSGAVGLLAAPFIDRFGRRRLMLFAYAGFITGTLACAVAHNFTALLAARAQSGAFGGLSSSMVLAVISDVVPAERRASGIGIVMTAFRRPPRWEFLFGLQLAEHFRWEAPFLFVGGFAILMWTLVFVSVPPLRGHLESQPRHPLRAFVELLGDSNALRALLFMAALVFGHFAIIPMLSPYLVSNVGLPEKDLFLVYFTGGVCTVFTAPLIGRLADTLGRFQVLACLVAVACVVTLAITNTGPLPLWFVLTLVGLFFTFASGRFVPGQAIMTLAVPASGEDAFMSLNGWARDLAAGLTSMVGGLPDDQGGTGRLLNFNWLGWMALASGVISVWLARRVRVNELPATERLFCASGPLPIPRASAVPYFSPTAIDPEPE